MVRVVGSRRSPLVAAAAVLLASVVLAPSGPLAAGAASPRCRDEVRTDVVYAKRAGQPASATSLDVYPAPGACAGNATPVVVWVHGGGWSVGDKRVLGEKLELFHDLGAAVVSVNYRLTERRPAGDGGDAVHHPAHADDVAAAVGWVTDHARGFGADPDDVVLVGHSAGAHLASLVGSDPRYLRDAKVDAGAVGCVVALDTEGYDLEEKAALGGRSAMLVRTVFGDDPAVLRDASPIAHAADGSPVQFLVVTRGSPHRRAEAARFVDAVEQAGGDASLVIAPGYSHADVNRRLGAAGETIVTPAVRDFVDRCA